jgi:hypothetical protein
MTKLLLANVKTGELIHTQVDDYPGDCSVVFIKDIVPEEDQQISGIEEADNDEDQEDPIKVGNHISNDYGSWEIMAVGEEENKRMMTPKQRDWFRAVVKKAQEKENLIDGKAAGPFDELLVAAIALQNAGSDPVGADEGDLDELDQMTLRCLEMYTCEKRP